MSKFLKTVRWDRARSVVSAALAAPPIPGVYVIGHVIGTVDLPTSIEWVYVGRSLKLRQRLAQHLPLIENHVALRNWIVANWNDVEVWFTTATPEHARLLEIELIRRLHPRFNRVRYRSITRIDKGEKDNGLADIA